MDIFLWLIILAVLGATGFSFYTDSQMKTDVKPVPKPKKKTPKKVKVKKVAVKKKVKPKKVKPRVKKVGK